MLLQWLLETLAGFKEYAMFETVFNRVLGNGQDQAGPGRKRGQLLRTELRLLQLMVLYCCRAGASGWGALKLNGSALPMKFCMK